MNKYKNLLLNIGLFALNMFANKLVVFLLVPFYTYYMSAGEYGVTDMSLTVITLIYPIATLSIAEAVLRYGIDDAKDTKSYVTAGVLITIAGCGIVAVCLPLLDLNFFGGLGAYKGLFLLAFSSNVFMLLFGNIARCLNQIKMMTWISIISSLVTGGSAVLFVGMMQLRIPGYFYSVALGQYVAVLLYLIWGKHYRYISIGAIRGLRTYVGPMVRYSFPLVPNSLFWWMSTSINRFFITGMLGITASGLFAASSKIPSILVMICSVFQQAWQLSAFQEFKKSDIKGFFSTIYRVFNAAMMMGAALIIVITPVLAKIMLQKEFFDSWYLIPILVLAMYFNTMNTFFGTIYTSAMKTKYLMISTAVGGVVVMVMTWVLVHGIGLLGASVAMAIANAVVLVMRMANSRPIIAVDIRWKFVIPCNVLLLLQGVVMTFQTTTAISVSAVLFLIICVVCLLDLIPFIKKTLTLLSSRARKTA
ncbi:lipopolysaccharide biosynthesis protein [Bifidobacterium aesculapii]|uniref:lipopolysaccharide biosynthesis protein n=1 Tax=Bifidobacterium aesculapii TaxID=1329411 RepID=UPI0006E45384|nr:oligosaccharide flippase family protein [Bifidobacterium aesculapii]